VNTIAYAVTAGGAFLGGFLVVKAIKLSLKFGLLLIL